MVKDRKYLIFDLDGTLFNSICQFYHKWIKWWKKRGIPAWLAHILFWVASWIERKFGWIRYKLKVQNIIGCKILIWNATGMPDEIPLLFDATEHVLEICWKKGIILFASSGASKAELRLKKVGLDKYFKLMFGAEEGIKKEHLKKMAEIENISLNKFCQQATSVGDIPHDMRVAREHNIYAVGVINDSKFNQYSKEDLIDAGAMVVIDKIEDLIELL